MKKTILKLQKVFIVAVIAFFGIVVLPAQPAFAATTPTTPATDVTKEVQKGITDIGGGDPNATDAKDKPVTLENLIKNVINTLLFIGGIVAVIMIIVGGLRFMTSNGDQGTVKAARETIMYSVVGLIVAILAYAIVNFVVLNIK